MKKNFGKKTILATLPVLIVATYDENGIPDAMNVAWGGQCSAHHVALNLAIGHKTTENLLKKKVFTLSIANLDNLVLSDYFGLVSGHKANKIEVAGVHVSKKCFCRCTRHRGIPSDFGVQSDWYGGTLGRDVCSGRSHQYAGRRIYLERCGQGRL